MIYLRGCEGEMCEWMDCDRYFPSVPFVVLTVDQLLGAVVARLTDWNRIATFFRKTGPLPLTRRKNQGHHYN